MPAAAAPVASELDYDLYLRPDARLSFGRLPEHGVRLYADRISWVAVGRERHAALDDIVEIHLTRGGGISSAGDSALVWMRAIAQRRATTMSVCRIRFRDGNQLTVYDGDAYGYVSPDRSARYSEFVVRLHERLAARDHRGIIFGAGYTLFRYRVLMAMIGLLALLDLAAIAALFAGIHPTRVVVVAGMTVGLWFQWRMVRENLPCRYHPAAVPDDMLPALVQRRTRPSARDAAEYANAGFTLPTLSQRWRWLLLLPALAPVAAIVWGAGVSETMTMFEPGAAARALAAVERAANEPLRIRKLEIASDVLEVTVAAPRAHGDSKGLASNIETWSVRHKILFGGWREWDSVSGPHRADSLPVLVEAFTKPFELRPRDMPDLAQLAQTAVANSGVKDGAARWMTLIEHDAINPIAGEDPLRWVVHVSSARESADVTLNHDGRYAGADRSGTARARNLNLLAGGKDLDEMLAAIRGNLGGGTALAFLRVERNRILLRTDQKQYEAGLDGVVDKTPAAFLCHMTTDITAGRFGLDGVSWWMLPNLVQRAVEASPDGGHVEAAVLSAPDPARDSRPQWALETQGAGRTVRVLFDHDGGPLGVRGWGDGHYCE